MADSMVLKITWLHELIYTSEGQPAAYDDLSVPLFISGYLAMMEHEKESIRPLMAWHLQKLIYSKEFYGWASVRTYTLSGSSSWKIA